MTKRVLIIGAGEAGRMVAREILADKDGGFEVVGFLDDETTLLGEDADGLPVLGQTSQLPELAAQQSIDEAIIAVPSGSREFVRRVVRLCRDAGIAFKIVPGLIEIIRGEVRLDQIREVHPEDLLGRETVDFDEVALARELEGRRVLVTGAGGSIGGELCRQLARFELGELILFGRGENQIFHIEEELRSTFPDRPIRTVIGDIRDVDALRRTFAAVKPQFVYHAAAHKHVHYMEAFPDEAVKNNVGGTKNIIDASAENGVERLVMLSTDKAVHPQGVMGATKRVAEYLMADRASVNGTPRLISVRFGNVLGSRGSVVPLFMRQIREGGPVTVSHKDASRFFMTLREACMLVIQASFMGRGGEVFILKMGSPIRIIEMAKDLITLHGLRPEVDVPIKVMGLRPGEKMHEDLVVEGEAVRDSEHDHILAAAPQLPAEWSSDEVVATLSALAREGNQDGIRDYLARIIPDANFETS
jgi:FlaA1/EpsC-like NDP-sugar epimerase